MDIRYGCLNQVFYQAVFYLAGDLGVPKRSVLELQTRKDYIRQMLPTKYFFFNFKDTTPLKRCQTNLFHVRFFFQQQFLLSHSNIEAIVWHQLLSLLS